MPGGDGTGPAGWGPMTGRAAGYCAGFSMPGFVNPAAGFGFGRFGGGRGFGRGGGWGRRNWFYATGLTGWQRGAYGYPSPMAAMPYAAHPAAFNVPYDPGYAGENELNYLKGQQEYLEDALEGIKQRLAELEQEQSEK